VQQDTLAIQLDREDTQHIGTFSVSPVERNYAHQQEIPAQITPPPEVMVNRNIDKSQHSFSMPLINVTDAVVRFALLLLVTLLFSAIPKTFPPSFQPSGSLYAHSEMYN